MGLQTVRIDHPIGEVGVKPRQILKALNIRYWYIVASTLARDIDCPGIVRGAITYYQRNIKNERQF